MNAIIGSLKPNMSVSKPTAAMIAPPGTPGAATIVIASMKMKPMNCGTFNCQPEMNITANENAVIFIIEPARWIVAHSGTTKLATASLTLLRFTCSNVTGIVAADDEVPRAVKYAGSMFLIATKGFLPDIAPAIMYWISSSTMCRTNASKITFKVIEITLAACPVAVMFRKIPKMCSGSSGMMMFSMTFMMISPRPVKPSESDLLLMYAKPIPIINDISKAPITSNSGGISILKYADSKCSSGFDSDVRFVSEPRSELYEK